MLKTLKMLAAAALLGTAAAQDTGCADGSREGFLDSATYPDIAGCSGAWSVPGISLFSTAPACPGLDVFNTLAPACDRQAGNDGTNPSGSGCNVADLCAPGWEVCPSEAVVAARAGSCADAVPTGQSLFFATRQSSNGCNKCALGTSTDSSVCNAESCKTGCLNTEWTSNDVYGCGAGAQGGNNIGSCGQLNSASGNLGDQLPGTWNLNAATSADNNGLCEAVVVTHSSPTDGGVLCCRSDAPIVTTFPCSASTGSCVDEATVTSDGLLVTLEFADVGECD